MRSGSEHHPLGDPSLTLQICSWIIILQSELKGSESNLLIVLSGKLRLRGVRAYSTVTQWVDTAMVRLKPSPNDSQCSLPQLGTDPFSMHKNANYRSAMPCFPPAIFPFYFPLWPWKTASQSGGQPCRLRQGETQCYENDKHSLRCGHEGTTPRGCLNAG